MKTSNNTILITGGSFGTGFELTKLLSAMGNHVIITGTNAEQLELVISGLKNVTPIVCNPESSYQVDRLVTDLTELYPNLNVFINNMGQSFFEYRYALNDRDFQAMEAYYLAGIQISERLTPLFISQENATFIDLTQLTLGLIEKQALQSKISGIVASYTHLLRHKLRNHSNVEIPILESLSIENNLNKSMLAFRVTEDIFNRASRQKQIPKAQIGNQFHSPLHPFNAHHFADLN